MKGELLIGDTPCPDCGRKEFAILSPYVMFEGNEDEEYCRCHTVDPRRFESYKTRGEYASKNIREHNKTILHRRWEPIK